MIGRLKGLLLEKQPPHLLIDVGGVGYEVETPMTTFYKLPEINQEVQLFTHLVVREDAQLLFGFFTEDERRLFRTLIKVNGVGAKVALGILSGIEAQEFAVCIHKKDSARLIKLPGIGKKTADRLIVEMRDRLDDWEIKLANAASTGQKITSASAENDAISALISLGFKPQEASRTVAELEIDGLSSEEIIRLALKSSIRK